MVQNKLFCIFALLNHLKIYNRKVVATITLEYNARNSMASKIIEIIMAMDVFKVKTPTKTSNIDLTRKAIQDIENGNIVTCESYEDYLKQTADYA